MRWRLRLRRRRCRAARRTRESRVANEERSGEWFLIPDSTRARRPVRGCGAGLWPSRKWATGQRCDITSGVLLASSAGQRDYITSGAFLTSSAGQRDYITGGALPTSSAGRGGNPQGPSAPCLAGSHCDCRRTGPKAQRGSGRTVASCAVSLGRRWPVCLCLSRFFVSPGCRPSLFLFVLCCWLWPT
jgi:hypothetical protein